MSHLHSTTAYRALWRTFCITLLLGLLTACNERIAQRQIAFSECRFSKLPTAAQCGIVDVPEDWSKQGGRSLGIAVVVLPANTLGPKPDPLFMFAGGPGQSAEAIVPFAAQLSGVRKNRDIVLIDPRGAGRSAPLNCAALSLRDPFDALLEDAMSDAVAKRCLTELRDAGSADIAQYTTLSFVNDLEQIRATLGYDRINLWGGSYGTRVAQEYLRRHPQRVRSVVLDSVAPPKMRLSLDPWLSRERALADVLAQCATDAACERAYPNLETSLARIRAALDGSGQISVIDPRTGSTHEVPLSYDQVIGALQALVYAPELASLIPPLIARAEAGDYAPLFAAAMMFTDDLSRTMNFALYYAVTCAEDAPRVAPAEAEQALATLRASALAEHSLAACGGWPRPSMPADFYAPVVSDTPVLILSGGLDPVTPPANGDLVASTLANSRHVIAAGYGHIVSPHACAPRLIEAFIDDAGFASLPKSCVDYLTASKPPAPFSSLLEPR